MKTDVLRLDMDRQPTCDWCDDDTGAIAGLPFTLADAHDDGVNPDRELTLCPEHIAIAIEGLEAALEMYVQHRYR